MRSALAFVRGHRAAGLARRDVEREGGGGPMCGLPMRLNSTRSIALASVTVPTVERAVRAHPLLVHDDRGRQPFQDIHVRPVHRRHESLHERAVGLVDQPLRLRRDGAEHERRLARSRDAGEHRQPPLGDLDADVLQVVRARALDADQIVAVCGVLVSHVMSSLPDSKKFPPRQAHASHTVRWRTDK